MNKQRMWVFRTVIVVLSVVLLSGCGASTSEGTSSVRTGETIASDSKWINSDIQGAIDGSTPTNVKDDFYTAVNRDWLLATTATEENPNTSNFTQNEKILRERKLAIVRQGQEATVSTGTQNPTGLTAEQLIHNQELVAAFASLAGDWESRNTEGVNPARPYLEAIESINSLD
ncbi:hypothetical protein, partial [Eubacterium aggregans]|uniref:hypothetical protein n=1 Tax=Eubacterium aggregans TaxID=81409 RepID=UPI003F3905DE